MVVRSALHAGARWLTSPLQLPLSLLRAAKDHPLLVELKNGETYNGHLVSCDNYMNVNLSDVTVTSRDADRFYKVDSVYIRGVQIKYLCVPQEVIGLVKEETRPEPGGGATGGGRGRGRGRGRGGGGEGKGPQQGQGQGQGQKRGRGGR
jgi:U6 snRNA-associated Sm-like protein LSm4